MSASSNIPQPEPHWLNKTEMAASLGISVQAFDKWGVKPVAKIGRSVYYDCRSVVSNRIDNELQKQQPAEDEEVDPSKLEYQRYRLTKEQADAQELKNQKERGEVVETEFATFTLSRIAAQIGSILDSVPLNMRRKFPELETKHIEHLKREIVKAQNIAAGLDEMIPELLDEYLANTS